VAVSFIGGGHWSTRRKSCIEYTSSWTRSDLTTLMVIRTDCISSCKSNYHTITTHWPVCVCDVLLTKLVCWLLDVLLPSIVNGCSYSSCWHVGYWMSYWHWWFLDTLFIVVIERFDRHKKKRLRTKLYDKTADLNFPIITLHLYVTIFLLHYTLRKQCNFLLLRYILSIIIRQK
jgi:hypothetical protein